MVIPSQIPYLRVITFIWAGYALLWITFEGSIPFVVTMSVSTTAVSVLHLLQRLAGRRIKNLWWFLGTGGVVSGIAAIGLTLFFMALKTGLHAHGPEFTPDEIRWVIQQTPLWGAIGGAIGGGIGLILGAVWRNE